MTRHIKLYRYEVQHGNDANFVAYQRKSSHGVWQTISMWMIPQPSPPAFRRRSCQPASDIRLRSHSTKPTTLHSVQRCTE
jgi:hypothetical protein